MTHDKTRFTVHRSLRDANKTRERFRPIEESSGKKDEEESTGKRIIRRKGGRGKGGGRGESFGLDERAFRGLKFQPARRAFISIRRGYSAMHGKCAPCARMSRMNIYIQMVYINSTQRKNGLDRRGIHPRRRYPPEAVANSPSLARRTTALRITLVDSLDLPLESPLFPSALSSRGYAPNYIFHYEAKPRLIPSKLKVDDASERAEFLSFACAKIHSRYLRMRRVAREAPRQRRRF